MTEHWMEIQSAVFQHPNSEEFHSPEDVKRIEHWAQNELASLMRRRMAVTERIRLIRSVIAAMADVFAVEVATDGIAVSLWRRRPENGRLSACRQRGLTLACRQIIQAAEIPLTTRELCRRIQQERPGLLMQHKQPVVSISVVMSRLARYGEVRSGMNENDLRTWVWIGENKKASEPG